MFGIFGGVLNEGLEINNNYFHDSLKSVRDWEVHYAKDATFDHNTLYNVFDGGHLLDPEDNVSVSYNYGTHIGRMGQEIQGDIASHNLKVVGNSFSDWVNPYYDSFGLSVVNHNAINTLVSGNYLGATIASGSSWGAADSGGTHRFGYGIEIGAVSATVENNTVVGDWVAGIVSSRNAVVQNNQIWGTYSWGDLTTEGGLDGQGKETLIGNTIHASNNGAPAAPSNPNNYNTVATGSDSSSVVTSTPTPVVTSSGISNLVVTVLSDTSVKLTWANDAGLTQGQISIVSTVGQQSFGTVALSDNATSATLTGLHAGWQLDFAVSGKNTAGSAVSSAAVTAQMTGDGTTIDNSTPTIATTTPIATPVTTPVTTPVSAPVTTPVTQPTTSNSITGLTATVLSDHSVKLTWTNSSALTSASVSIVTTVGRQVFSPVSVGGNVSTITINNLHAGWKFDFAVTGMLANGATVTSGVATVQTTGNSSTATAGDPTVSVGTVMTSQPVQVTPTITNVTATALSNTSVQLSWAVNGATQSGLQIGVVTTVGRTVYPGITYSSDQTTAIISGLHAGWQYDFTVGSVTADGQILSSDPVTVQLKGNASAAVAIGGKSSLLAA